MEQNGHANLLHQALRKRAFAAATGYSRLLFFDGISTDAIHLPLRDLRSIYGVRRNGAEMGL